jgi:hypothetical protein
MKRLLLVVTLILTAATAEAQSAVVWNHTDWSDTASYELGYFALPVLSTHQCDLAAPIPENPVSVDNLGKPVTTTGVDMQAPLPTRRIGCWALKIRALSVDGLYSLWSVPSDPFAWQPAAPSKPVKK